MSAGPAGGRQWDLIVLSPHLDDAILSCGGRLAAVAEAGGRSLIVTPLAGDEPSTAPDSLAARLRAAWQLPAGGVVAARRAEDRAAADTLGAEVEHWPFLEALYRHGADGLPLYPRVELLYGEPAPEDAPLIAQLAERIAALPSTRLLLAPLTVGGHIDHRLVRRAAESSGRTFACYEEFPYSEWKWFAVRRALERRTTWRAEVQPLSRHHLERKEAAILAYQSQVPSLFRTAGRLGRQLRRHARRSGGERIWWRRDSAPPR